MVSRNELPFERLVDWVEGRLSPAEAQAVAQQVAAADAKTQAQLEWLRAFHSLTPKVVLATPEPAVRSLLKARFAHYAQAKQTPGLFQRLLAALTFDSAQQPALAGVRASETAQVRQLVYTASVADVVLHVQQRKQDQRFTLMGQLLPNDQRLTDAPLALDALYVQLMQATEEMDHTMANSLGEFRFDAVAPGSYTLILSSDQFELHLSGFEL